MRTLESGTGYRCATVAKRGGTWPNKNRVPVEVMAGCLLVGASYALFNTQTHAVGAVAAVGVEDSKVRASMGSRNGVRLTVEVDFTRCWTAAAETSQLAHP